MEILTVAILVLIFIVECIGVYSLRKIGNGIDRDPRHKIPHNLGENATMVDRGVLPIKRKTEQEHWESEVARVASRPKFG